MKKWEEKLNVNDEKILKNGYQTAVKSTKLFLINFSYTGASSKFFKFFPGISNRSKNFSNQFRQLKILWKHNVGMLNLIV